MSVLVRGDAIEQLVDAARVRLADDATLAALVTGVFGHVPEAARTSYPYLRVNDPDSDGLDFGAMGPGGERIEFSVDGWSAAKGPHEIRQIMARVKVLLYRHDFVLDGHRVVAGSLVLSEYRDFEEPDADMPNRRLYHGHHTWEGLVEAI